MASYGIATHLTATVFLLPIGLRRLFCSSSLYLKNPSLFRSKIWYLSDPRWKNLDLYFLAVALPLASLTQILIFLSFSSHPTYRFSFLHQSLVLSLYWVLAILFLLRDCLNVLAIADNFLFMFAGIVFFLEDMAIGKGVSGLIGGVVYGLCGDLTVVCGCCCLYLAVKPRAFFAEFFLSCGLVLKGTWFLQAGLSLYMDAFSFKGCKKLVVTPQGNENVELRCDLEEDGLRGAALANLLFVGHAIGAFLLCMGIFWLLSSNRNWRHSETHGPLLAGLESETALMRALPELELE
ncbi:hypothetical protein Tsubulata_009509 [Turnera subulata]|uniref:Uncharacterized protein n=1 Tax=Turnera subulata TaxID=218843 RepID=A0A9Q0FCS9_9ROSI|nr:hypothetical protein Tsubulata_009509 [Turnera subulata]